MSIDRSAVELGLNRRQELALLFGNAQALEGALDVLRDFITRNASPYPSARINNGSCRS